MHLADQSVSEYLDATAAPTPAPGGGSAAAAACGLAAALVEMAAGIEARRAGASERMAAIPARAAVLRGRALELAEEELGSYAPVLAARRLDRADPRRAARVKAALAEASRTPQQIAEGADEVAALGATVAAECDPSVRGDARAGVLL